MADTKYHFATDVLAEYEASAELRAAIKKLDTDGAGAGFRYWPPETLLVHLLDQRLFADAVVYAVYWLRRQELYQWTNSIVKALPGANVDPARVELQVHIDEWIRSPSDETRQNVTARLGAIEGPYPILWLAQSIVWTGGYLVNVDEIVETTSHTLRAETSDEHQVQQTLSKISAQLRRITPELVAPQLYRSAMVATLRMAAPLTNPEDAEQALKRYAIDALKLGSGGTEQYE